MKFLVDAQLPRRLAVQLQSAGYDALHTLDLPLQNRTPDSEVCSIADQENRVVVSKDADFVHSHLLHGRPRKLLLISTGNITNNALDSLLSQQMDTLAHLFEVHDFVEISRTAIVVHR